MDLLLRGSVTLRNFEGMVPTFDDIERCTQAMARDYFADFFSGSESIARALDKKHGRLDVFQVGVAKLFMLTGRMKWVAEKDKASYVACARIGSRDLRCDAPA